MTRRPAVDVDLAEERDQEDIRIRLTGAEKDFIFPTGRAWAEDLGYPEELSQVPDSSPSPSQAFATRGCSGASNRAAPYSTSAPARA